MMRDPADRGAAVSEDYGPFKERLYEMQLNGVDKGEEIIYRKTTMKETATTAPSTEAPEPCCTLAITGAEQNRFVEMLRAAGSPVRFEILKFLVTHPGCITADVVKALPIAQATVSQHLKRLRQAGWIEARPDGTATCYGLNSENVAWFRRWVEEIF